MSLMDDLAAVREHIKAHHSATPGCCGCSETYAALIRIEGVVKCAEQLMARIGTGGTWGWGEERRSLSAALAAPLPRGPDAESEPPEYRSTSEIAEDLIRVASQNRNLQRLAGDITAHELHRLALHFLKQARELDSFTRLKAGHSWAGDECAVCRVRRTWAEYVGYWKFEWPNGHVFEPNGRGAPLCPGPTDPCPRYQGHSGTCGEPPDANECPHCGEPNGEHKSHNRYVCNGGRFSLSRGHKEPA